MSERHDLVSALWSAFRTLWACREPSRLQQQLERDGSVVPDALVDVRSKRNDPPIAVIAFVTRLAIATTLIWAGCVETAIWVSWGRFAHPQTLRFILGTACATAVFCISVAAVTSLGAAAMTSVVATALGLAVTVAAMSRPRWFTHAGDFSELGYFTLAWTLGASVACASVWLARARKVRPATGVNISGARNLVIVAGLSFAWALFVYVSSQQTGLVKPYVVAVLIFVPALGLLAWRLTRDRSIRNFRPVALAAAPVLTIVGAAAASPALIQAMVDGCVARTVTLFPPESCGDVRLVLNDGAGVGALGGLCIAATFIAIDFVVVRRAWTAALTTTLVVALWLLVLKVRWAFVDLDRREQWVTDSGAVAGAVFGYAIAMAILAASRGRQPEEDRTPQRSTNKSQRGPDRGGR